MPEGKALSVIIWPLISQFFAVAVVMSIKPSPIVELEASESLSLSILYVVILLAFASLIVYLMRKGRRLAIKSMIFILLVYSAFLSLDTLISSYMQVSPILEIALSIIIALLSFRTDLIGNIAKSFLAASMAFLFIYFFNDTFIYFLLASLSIYDAYSVFRGPLSKLFSASEDVLSPLSLFHGGVSMGLGDVFCYSMASATSFRSLHFLALVPILSLNLGIIVTIILLGRSGRPLPGLTIPILMWLVPQVLLSL